MESDPYTSQEVLKYLLIADGGLLRAQGALGDPPSEPAVMESLQAARAAIRDAELKLWLYCDPWALLQEGIW